MDERKRVSQSPILRRMLFGCAAALALAAALTATRATPGGNPPKGETLSPIDATLEQVAWLAGSWSGPGLGGTTEEHWTKPAGGSMLGMFRLVNGKDKTQVSELLMIEQEGSHLVYRFRHFGPGHKPWEELDKPLVFDLVKVGPSEAIFDSSVQTDPKRLTYRRNGDKMTIQVQGEKEGVLGKGFELSLTRTKPDA